MDGQPGDKSPGYYCVSLRDEVKTRFSNVHTAGPLGFGAQNSLAKHIQTLGWATFSWPLRATEWKRPNSFGPCDAKHVLKDLRRESKLVFNS
jgi:hypothetical protein